MPSGRVPKLLDPSTATFFLDRSVGKHTVSAALREQGVDVRHMGEIYPYDGQFISDPEWILRCGQNGWVAITKDGRLVGDHWGSIELAGLRLFVFPNANLTGAEMATRIRNNWNRMLSHVRRPGPYAYAILPHSLARRWPAKI